MRKTIALLCVVMCVGNPWILTASSGKITGIVKDAVTKTPLIGANILVEGTVNGAAADLDGKYIILNVSPGVYTLRARMMGYNDVRIENVRVASGLTSEYDIELSETVLSGEAVTIVAERPMVTKDLTSTTAVMGADDIKALPVTELSEALELQAGMIKDAGGGLHIRGGRSGEISYWIDGVPVTDVYDGGTVVDVNKDMVQELQVLSGAFNAEYGQAMSGIVNITTKEGNNSYSGSLTAYFGDHLSSHKNIFDHIGSVTPLAIQNYEGSFSGSIIKDKLFFYLNGRYMDFDGWLYGQRRYNPNAVSGTVVLDSDILGAEAPEYMDESRDMGDGTRGFVYVLGTNSYLDSLVTYSSLPESKRSNPDSFAVYYNKLRAAHTNGKGDGKFIPMNWNRKIYAQGKLIYRFSSALRLSYNYIYDDVDYNDYERDYKYNPDGASNKFRQGQTHIFQINHTLSSRTFYSLGFSYFSKGFNRYLYENMFDSRYVHPDLQLQNPYCFKVGGTSDAYFQRKTSTALAKLDLTSQITTTHQIKAGAEFRTHRVFQDDITLRPIQSQTDLDLVFNSPFIQTRVLPESTIYHSRYEHRPVEMSAYLQDKMEFKNMIVNFGLRLDYFKPDGVVLTDETDPSIYNPIKPQNRYHDYGTDGIPNSHDTNGTEDNGIQDSGESYVTLAERQVYWYNDASTKLQVSPRIGISFPITDRGVIHFSYGHFFQIPRFERLYQNPDFELGSGTGNVGVIGNADLEPEQTISGEVGLQQQLTDDVSLNLTGYFRDIRNLAGTRADEIVIYGGSAKYSRFINSDFGFIRGIILALNKRFSGGLTASLDYTLMVAKGTNSNPEQARNALSGGALPEVQLTSLEWDQTHTVNASLSYSGKMWGGSLVSQVGTGLPYTPRASEDITTLLTNSQRKPGSFNVDMRAYRDFKIGPGKLSLFMSVYNLFDRLNELNVFSDTGRAGFTMDEEIARATHPPEIVNTLDEWYTNSTYYSEPRRIEFGFTYMF